MNCNAKSLCITSIMLMTMSKNPALSQKVLENWLRLPESQELFAGLQLSEVDFNLIYIGYTEFSTNVEESRRMGQAGI